MMNKSIELMDQIIEEERQHDLDILEARRQYWYDAAIRAIDEIEVIERVMKEIRKMRYQVN